jgi:hypothetical protein
VEPPPEPVELPKRPRFGGHAARSSAASVSWRPAETFALALNDRASDPAGCADPEAAVAWRLVLAALEKAGGGRA